MAHQLNSNKLFSSAAFASNGFSLLANSTLNDLKTVENVRAAATSSIPQSNGIYKGFFGSDSDSYPIGSGPGPSPGSGSGYSSSAGSLNIRNNNHPNQHRMNAISGHFDETLNLNPLAPLASINEPHPQPHSQLQTSNIPLPLPHQQKNLLTSNNNNKNIDDRHILEIAWYDQFLNHHNKNIPLENNQINPFNSNPSSNNTPNNINRCEGEVKVKSGDNGQTFQSYEDYQKRTMALAHQRNQNMPYQPHHHNRPLTHMNYPNYQNSQIHYRNLNVNAPSPVYNPIVNNHHHNVNNVNQFPFQAPLHPVSGSSSTSVLGSAQNNMNNKPLPAVNNHMAEILEYQKFLEKKISQNSSPASAPLTPLSAPGPGPVPGSGLANGTGPSVPPLLNLNSSPSKYNNQLSPHLHSSPSMTPTSSNGAHVAVNPNNQSVASTKLRADAPTYTPNSIDSQKTTSNLSNYFPGNQVDSKLNEDYTRSSFASGSLSYKSKIQSTVETRDKWFEDEDSHSLDDSLASETFLNPHFDNFIWSEKPSQIKFSYPSGTNSNKFFKSTEKETDLRFGIDTSSFHRFNYSLNPQSSQSNAQHLESKDNSEQDNSAKSTNIFNTGLSLEANKLLSEDTSSMIDGLNNNQDSTNEGEVTGESSEDKDLVDEIDYLNKLSLSTTKFEEEDYNNLLNLNSFNDGHRYLGNELFTKPIKITEDNFKANDNDKSINKFSGEAKSVNGSLESGADWDSAFNNFDYGPGLAGSLLVNDFSGSNTSLPLPDLPAENDAVQQALFYEQLYR